MFDLSQTSVEAAESAGLRRPRLLMRAAAAGQCNYERGRDLRRLLAGALPSPREAVARLEEVESRDELRRAQDSAAYSPQHHVAILTALLAEKRLLRAAEAARAGEGGKDKPALRIIGDRMN